MAHRTILQAAHLNRRELITGLAAAVASSARSEIGNAQGPKLELQAKSEAIALRQGGPKTEVWSLSGAATDILRFKRGEGVELAFSNLLPVPSTLNWLGMVGIPASEPLLGRPPLVPNNHENSMIFWRHAGTFMSDIRLLGDGQERPSKARAVVVQESEAVTVDRDEVLLFEDWRMRPDGEAISPGLDPKDTSTVATINGLTTLDIPARVNERLRIRLINGFQRNVIAVKIDNTDVRVMALDGQPAEPFSARNGAVVLAPGGRVDVFLDVTTPPGMVTSILLHDGTEPRQIARVMTLDEAPIRSAALPPAAALPSNGLPERLDLKNALRVDVKLGGSRSDWLIPATFANTAAPAFRAKPGRTVVLALINLGDRPQVFHLHGHHFRLLDRLDDGWKPFWLDTLAIEPGQTQRIAFAAEHAGHWLMETMATDWAARRLLRWYSVE